ncbi:type III-B CRISPR module RAMP protein Cmr1 [Vibrio palustris]|uniref:CRISPR type III-associated protein domain-containing protein n=1 Tax=Vibrio palustris TaxID=1918946 RepID=A0A1R4B2T9_9VIBR|nr:type III-B CRISPR module RAMP protein Cmr1 [Vibrio palustris]SJL83234.1 hypothetical protein VPAL9027_01188 [Vibrio palustris]
MRRKTNQDFESLQEALKTTPTKTWQTYNCTLVTPMYGGGVKAGEVDKDMPIRASSIRGQLRFWWRIACGPFNSPKEMFDRETAIWGGIGDDGATVSQVEIRVSNVDCKGEVAAFEYERHHKDRNKFKSVPKPHPELGHAYALFSAQGKLSKDKTAIEELPHKIAKTGLFFELQLNFKTHTEGALISEQINEVKESIRWWSSFGGVGSRTRRGLGAVKVTGDGIIPVTRGEVEEKGGVLELVTRNGKPETDAHAVVCWRYGCDKLRDFRQAKNVGRNPPKPDSKSPAGQSRWPEANSVRNLAESHSKKHSPSDPKTNFFPRASFGLPIIFHFQQDSGPGREPDDHTLKVADKDKERMASPLVLCPYYNGKYWESAALLLPDWQKALHQRLELSPKPSNVKNEPMNWSFSPEQQRLLAGKDKPMEGRRNDPLSAFLDYFEKGQ